MSERTVMVAAITPECAISDDGEQFPVDHYLDEFGDECDADDAAVLIAGCDATGWVAIDLSAFDEVAIH